MGVHGIVPPTGVTARAAMRGRDATVRPSHPIAALDVWQTSENDPELDTA